MEIEAPPATPAPELLNKQADLPPTNDDQIDVKKLMNAKLEQIKA